MTDHCSSSSSESDSDEPQEEEDKPLISLDQVMTETSSVEEDVTEGKLWDELDKELTQQKERDSGAMEEEAAAKEIREEETVITSGGDSFTAQNQSPVSAFSTDFKERSQRFYPPGKIMHIVSVTVTESETERDEVLTFERLGSTAVPLRDTSSS
ncbi:hypothetical protein Bca4012_023890 [Brassica carinata]|uniref:Uncharacterized protein n=1 Tax=Brassica carinata TaxID=52824 RepID=A0A8X7NUD5_BRACI|nr:hypothetical protein Bca52824_089980 [Brassica carinata]